MNKDDKTDKEVDIYVESKEETVKKDYSIADQR